MDVESSEFMGEAELACVFHITQDSMWCYYNLTHSKVAAMLQLNHCLLWNTCV